MSPPGKPGPESRSSPGLGNGAEDRDGRRLRAARNRESVLVAVLDIIKEQGGGPPPGAAEVASRAKVSERTVFRHFADLDSLFMAAAARQRPVLENCLSPRPAHKELEARVSAVVGLRAKLFEQIAPVRRVAGRLAFNPVVAEQMAEVHVQARRQLAEVFAPELARLSPARRTVVLDELDAVTSWPTWERLRSAQDCSVARAREVVADLVTATLRPLRQRRRR